MFVGRRFFSLAIAALTIGTSATAGFAETTANKTSESSANTQLFPKQILKTGIVLNSPGLSPNSTQLSNTIGLTPVLEQIQSLRARVEQSGRETTLEGLSARQDLWEAIQKAQQIILKTDLEIEFAVSEMEAERQVYTEILSTFTNDRDKAIARTNALGFISNGALWAVCEALAIPTYKNAKFAIPSGIIGIPAGVVPSIASMYTLKQINGKKRTSEVEPNMLAKVFNYPTTTDIEYPKSVWQFLNQAPIGDTNGKTRREQLIDRWIADSNIPSFTDRTSKKQLDVLTASVAQRKGLSIATLSTRCVMLEQLEAEVMKMSRMLLELTMAVQGEKQLTASAPDIARPTTRIGMNQQ